MRASRPNDKDKNSVVVLSLSARPHLPWVAPKEFYDLYPSAEQMPGPSTLLPPPRSDSILADVSVQVRGAFLRSQPKRPKESLHEGNHTVYGCRTQNGFQESCNFPRAKLNVYPEIWFKMFGYFG